MIQTPEPELEPQKRPAPENRSILLIDDEVDQLVPLAKRLNEQGFSTLEAYTASAGLQLAQSERPDLIVLDLGLPDRDGFELCEQLSDGLRTCDIPIVVVSGLDDADIVRRAQASGCGFFLHKPYDPRALLTLIEAALSEAEAW